MNGFKPSTLQLGRYLCGLFVPELHHAAYDMFSELLLLSAMNGTAAAAPQTSETETIQTKLYFTKSARTHSLSVFDMH